MPTKGAFDIAFAGLKDGDHTFNFSIDSSFFEDQGVTDVKTAAVKANIALSKSPTLLVLSFLIHGKVEVPCDRCLDPLNVSIESDHEVYVKFGENAENATEDVMILPPNAHQLNVGQQLYELIMLAIPSRRVHEEGQCNSAVIEKLSQLQPSEDEEEDPRWSELKKLNI